MGTTNEERAQELARNEKELLCLQHQQQRLENRQKYLDKGERKKRNHQLITRGAAIESVLPAVKPLTEVAFYTLMENIAEIDAVQSAVNDAVSKQQTDAIPTGGDG